MKCTYRKIFPKAIKKNLQLAWYPDTWLSCSIIAPDSTPRPYASDNQTSTHGHRKSPWQPRKPGAWQKEVMTKQWRMSCLLEHRAVHSPVTCSLTIECGLLVKLLRVCYAHLRVWFWIKCPSWDICSWVSFPNWTERRLLLIPLKGNSEVASKSLTVLIGMWPR